MATLRVSNWAQKEWQVRVTWAVGESSMAFYDHWGALMAVVYRYGQASSSTTILSFSDSKFGDTAFETVMSTTTTYGVNSALRKAITFDLRSYYDFKIEGLYEDGGTKINSGETASAEFVVKGTAGSRGEGKIVSVFVDGVLIGTSKVVGGKWALETAHSYNDGQHRVTAIIDRNGYNRETKETQISIDTQAPDVSMSSLVHALDGNGFDFTAGTISDASKVMVSGNVSADAVSVLVYVAGVLQGQASVNNGSWNFSIIGLQQGQSKVEIKAFDRVGNVEIVERTLNNIELNDGQTWSQTEGWGAVNVSKAFEKISGFALVHQAETAHVAGQTVDANQVGHVGDLHAAGFKGSGITVAILDTGIRSEFFDSNRISSKSYNFVDRNFDVTDHDGHGTFQASVIGKNTLNNAVKGLAEGASLMVLKVADTTLTASSTGYTIDEAIRYAVDNGADIISMAFGTTGSSYLRWALEYAQAHDVIVVASGGNDGTQTFVNPASYGSTLDAIVGVGGYTFNQTGNLVHSDTNVAGTNQSFNAVLNASENIQGLDYFGQIRTGSGASVATAITAAHLALLDSVNSHDSYREVIGALTSSAQTLQNHNVI